MICFDIFPYSFSVVFLLGKVSMVGVGDSVS